MFTKTETMDEYLEIYTIDEPDNEREGIFLITAGISALTFPVFCLSDFFWMSILLILVSIFCISIGLCVIYIKRMIAFDYKNKFFVTFSKIGRWTWKKKFDFQNSKGLYIVADTDPEGNTTYRVCLMSNDVRRDVSFHVSHRDAVQYAQFIGNKIGVKLSDEVCEGV